MPNAAGALVRLVSKGWPLLLKYGPQVVTALGGVTKWAQEHPAVPTALRQRLTDLPKRLVDVQKRHGDAAKIRGTLEIVRDVAREAASAGRPDVDADLYARRADAIEQGVRLAEAQGQPAKKESLARLRSRTDELLTDLMNAVTDSAPAQSAE